MIAVRLLLKSAPGVIAISLRLTIVVGVICSGFTVRAPSETVTCSLRAPIMSWKCSTGALPDAITISWTEGAKPSLRTVTRYAPTGRAVASKPPSASVVSF